MYRLGLYTGKIYGKDRDPATINECCECYAGAFEVVMDAKNGIFPSKKCIGCNECLVSKSR